MHTDMLKEIVTKHPFRTGVEMFLSFIDKRMGREGERESRAPPPFSSSCFLLHQVISIDIVLFTICVDVNVLDLTKVKVFILSVNSHFTRLFTVSRCYILFASLKTKQSDAELCFSSF